MSRSTAVRAAQATPIATHAGTPCQVAGETIRIGKLSIAQWLAIADLGVTWGFSMTPEERAKFGAMQDTSKGATNGQADPKAKKDAELASNMMTVRSLLKEPVLLGFYAILVDREPDAVRDTFDLAEFADVLAAADEHNDLRRVWAAFSRVASRWQPPAPKASETAAASDPPWDLPPVSGQP